MVSQDLSSTVVNRWVPLHIDGVVSGLHYSGNWRSRRYCSVTNKHRLGYVNSETDCISIEISVGCDSYDASS